MERGRQTVFATPQLVVNRQEKPKGLVKCQQRSSLLPDQLPLEKPKRTIDRHRTNEQMQSGVPLTAKLYHYKPESTRLASRSLKKSQANAESYPMPLNTQEKNRIIRIQSELNKKSNKPVNTYKCKAVMDKFCHGMLL